jgi:hypothetical protein
LEFHVQQTKKLSKRHIRKKHFSGIQTRLKTKKRERRCFKISLRHMRYYLIQNLKENMIVEKKCLRIKEVVAAEGNITDSLKNFSDMQEEVDKEEVNIISAFIKVVFNKHPFFKMTSKIEIIFFK